MKRKFWNWVRNEGEPAVLVLNGEISDETWFGDEVTTKLFRADPVSYTHLDVYKRQIYGSTKKQGGTYHDHSNKRN